MTKNEKRITPIDSGFFHNIAREIKLILRLMTDKRVNPALKLLPALSLLYFIFFPDFALGPFDDMLVLGIGTYLFIELCPPEVVEEHRKQLDSTVEALWRDADDAQKTQNLAGTEDIIDGEFRDE